MVIEASGTWRWGGREAANFSSRATIRPRAPWISRLRRCSSGVASSRTRPSSSTAASISAWRRGTSASPSASAARSGRRAACPTSVRRTERLASRSTAASRSRGASQTDPSTRSRFSGSRRFGMAGKAHRSSAASRAIISATVRSSPATHSASVEGRDARTASAPGSEEANLATRSSASAYSRTFSACEFILSA